MNVEIYSRKQIEALMRKEKFHHTAIISFYDSKTKRLPANYRPIDYSEKALSVFQIGLLDIDYDVLTEFGLTYDTYFPEADEAAKFIYSAKDHGRNIICQCEYGQSRSAGCAAAILEHFYQSGIRIFADYRYYPNQMVFHKIFDALEKEALHRNEPKENNSKIRQAPKTGF